MLKHSKIKTQVSKAGVFNLALDKIYEKDVVCLEPGSSVFEAAKFMLDKHIGDVVIAEERNGKAVPVGMLTDRDIVIKCAARKLDPTEVKISEIMTKKIVTAQKDEDLSELVRMFSDEGVSRMPIVDGDGSLVGILSSKKLFQYLTQGLCELSSISVEQQRREEKTH